MAVAAMMLSATLIRYRLLKRAASRAMCESTGMATVARIFSISDSSSLVRSLNA
jgi:hypothetical protein